MIRCGIKNVSLLRNPAICNCSDEYPKYLKLVENWNTSTVMNEISLKQHICRYDMCEWVWEWKEYEIVVYFLFTVYLLF